MDANEMDDLIEWEDVDKENFADEDDDCPLSGFSIHACLPSQCLRATAAAEIEEWLPRQYGYSVPTPRSDFRPLHRGGFGKDWWNSLVGSVQYAYEDNRAPNLDSYDLWLTLFLPLDIVPSPLYGPVESDPINDGEEYRVELIECASLPGALQELQRFAAKNDLPTDRAGLEELREQYNDNYLYRHFRYDPETGIGRVPEGVEWPEDDHPGMVDDEGGLRIYAEFMLAALFAMEEGVSLWVAK